MPAFSIGIAIAASFVALWLFFQLRRGTSMLMRLARVGAAFVMGLAISGMHYTGMAASRFSPGYFCIGAGTIDQRWLALTITVLAITTILLVYDSHLDSRTRKHNAQLEKANAQLEHAATHDALTGLPNRVLLANRLAQATAQSEHHSLGFAVLVELDMRKAGALREVSPPSIHWWIQFGGYNKKTPGFLVLGFRMRTFDEGKEVR